MIATIISDLLNSIIQVILFSLIPFIAWLVTARKKESFFSWIGLKKPTSDKKEILKFALIALVICELIGLPMNKFILNSDWNQSSNAGMGILGLPGALLYSFIQTAFSEEILFRGFIQKRLQKVFSFKIATLIQAVIFGFAHIVLILDKLNFAQGVALVLFPIIPGIFFAYINEKKADGSILPSWLMHGTMNIITQLIQL